MAAGIVAGGGPFGYGEGYGAFGGYWAFRALGAGMNGRGLRPMATRPDMTRGLLTPATEDLSALAVTGQDPTVLAFALGARDGQVGYEVLNLPDPPTFVFRSPDPAALNRALDDAGFRPGAAVPVIAQIPHDDHWAERMGVLFRPST